MYDGEGRKGGEEVGGGGAGLITRTPYLGYGEKTSKNKKFADTKLTITRAPDLHST